MDRSQGLYVEPHDDVASVDSTSWHSLGLRLEQGAEGATATTFDVDSTGAFMKPEWTYSPIDGHIYSANFHHDAALKLTGDFDDDAQKTDYAEKICAMLNARQPEGPQVTSECTPAKCSRKAGSGGRRRCTTRILPNTTHPSFGQQCGMQQ